MPGRFAGVSDDLRGVKPAFVLVTLLAVFAGETHHSGYMPAH